MDGGNAVGQLTNDKSEDHSNSIEVTKEISSKTKKQTINLRITKVAQNKVFALETEAILRLRNPLHKSLSLSKKNHQCKCDSSRRAKTISLNLLTVVSTING